MRFNRTLTKPSRFMDRARLEEDWRVLGDVPGLHALGLQFKPIAARPAASNRRSFSILIYLGALFLALALGFVVLQSPRLTRLWTTMHDVAATPAGSPDAVVHVRGEPAVIAIDANDERSVQ